MRAVIAMMWWAIALSAASALVGTVLDRVGLAAALLVLSMGASGAGFVVAIRLPAERPQGRRGRPAR